MANRASLPRPTTQLTVRDIAATSQPDEQEQEEEQD
jgi:hypothetical protein